MTKLKEIKKDYSSLKSIIIIIAYFCFPYLVSFISKSNLVSAVVYLLFALLLIYIYKDTFISDVKDISKNRWKYVKKIFIGIILIFFSTVLINIFIDVFLKINLVSENDYSLLKIFDKSPIILMLLTCVYYPIIEGIVFRKAIRDVIDKKWIFIIFSSLFYFFFNIVYTSMSFNTIISSLCYISTMIILSYNYYKTNNFSMTVIMSMVYNIIISLITFL